MASNARRINSRARDRRSETLIERAEEEVDGQPTAEELVNQRQARAVLDSVLATMSVETRAVFTLFELEEMTVAEIASLLGVPTGTVSSRLRRAREQFDEQLRATKAALDRLERREFARTIDAKGESAGVLSGTRPVGTPADRQRDT